MSQRDEDDDFKKLFTGTGGTFRMPDVSGSGAVAHADDAVDYENFDELADDDDLPDEESPPPKDDELMEGQEEEEAPLISEADLAPDEVEEDDMVDTGEHLGELTDSIINTHDYPVDYEDDDWTREFVEGGKQLIYHVDHHVDDLHMDGFGMGFDQPNVSPTQEKHVAIKEEEAPSFSDVQVEEEMPRETQVPQKPTEEELLQTYYPNFKPGAVLKLNTLFGPKPSKINLPKPKAARQCVPTRAGLEVELDQRSVFKSKVEPVNKPAGRPNVVNVTLKGSKKQKERKYTGGNDVALDKELIMASAEWEVPELWHDLSSEDEKVAAATGRKRQRGAVVDELYNSEDEEAFLNGTYKPSRKQIKLDLNDSNLLFVEDQQRRAKVIKRTSQVPTSERQLLSRYNVSNDRAYDMLKENYQSKVRSTIGNLTIDHSMVALRLQSPHYKVKLSKAQMRSHHRPAFVVKPNTTIQFAKVKQRKKKKDKGKHISQLLNKTSDLTLGDSASFFMLEYSEEFPLVLSNFGMGSKLINYYRKKNSEDTSRPKLPTGETNVLSTQDKSAFWDFGFVEPGNIVPTLYNRMIRAPVFKHEPQSTDFLLARTTGGGIGQKYYLRTIPHLFVVGQTFPVTTIPGPHSRKVTTASKNRLKMIVYRVLNQNPRHRLLVKDISSHFPDQNDMQNRQRLKEFMEYQRQGEDQGFWKVKASEPLPKEDSIRAMITPEDIALLEAMQVGQQHLEDAGYGKTVEDDSGDQDGMSLEEQMAPWNITRNFINATQGKAMLQLHGEGDPSGRGEAFSFLRTSMKGGFKAAGASVNEQLDRSRFGGHKYNVAEQDKQYREEIKRIWYRQKASLESTNTDDLGWDEAESKRDNFQGRSEPITPAGEDFGMSTFSHDSANTNANQRNKVLRITRFVKDKNGTRQRRVETVTDPNVIRAYVKRRQKLEDEKRAESLAAASVDGFTDRLKAENMAPSSDAEQNRRNKKILEGELARLQRNQDRRIARKAQKLGADPTQPQSGKGIGKGKSTTRKCATCGAVGHIRTNKACPMYNERFGGNDINMPPPPSKPTS